MRSWQKIALGIGLTAVVFFPRVLDLDAFRSPDEDRWMANTNGFTTKLAHGRLDELVQLPHPGITTQWLGALTIRYDDWPTRKLPLVLGQGALILLAGYVFGRLWGKSAGIFTVLTLAANPLLYAHTRVYAMDGLLALFCALALGFLLLWRQEKGQAYAVRYLVASAFCTAAAILSKLPGIALLPIIVGALLYWSWQKKKLLTTHYQLQTTGTWLLAFIISLALILPSLALAPSITIGNFLDFFRSDDYQELHQLGPYYYLGTLAFFSAPVHWLALVLLVWLARQRRISRLSAEQLVVLLGFAVILVIQMTLGGKKGDRYILPSFVALDIVSAWVIAQVYGLMKKVDSSWYLVASIKKYILPATSYLLLATLIWQFLIIWQTHPHTLAYVNPLTKTWLGERRHGWGEGLDLAAAYLNEKKDAADLKVAAYYPNEFAPYFKGATVPVHQHDNPSVNYVVLYRAMFERGQEWETDVVNHYRGQPAEHIIYFQGVPFVWLYATAPNTAVSR